MCVCLFVVISGFMTDPLPFWKKKKKKTDYSIRGILAALYRTEKPPQWHCIH